MCKVMFLNNLGASEMVARTAFMKVNHIGNIEKEQRGGRVPNLKLVDEQNRKEIAAHIYRSRSFSSC